MQLNKEYDISDKEEDLNIKALNIKLFFNEIWVTK